MLYIGLYHQSTASKGPINLFPNTNLLKYFNTFKVTKNLKSYEHL